MPMTTETVLEIDLNALAHNYNYITAKLKSDVKVMAVVKAFGYGSDAIAIAQELVKLGVDYFAVAYTPEGVALRDAGIETPIMVLHPLSGNLSTIIDRCLEPCLYSEKILKEFIDVAEKREQKGYPIHLKFNTGLNRLGFSENDVTEIIKKVQSSSSVKVRSILSHLAASEDVSEAEFTKSQLAKFGAISEKMIDSLGYKPMLHTTNTSGIINYPEAHLDMVRTGIGLYGFGNDAKENSALKPIVQLKTVISQIHDIEVEESVGYNRAFVASRKTRSATLPIGHADGISRSYGNGKGWVLINGKRASILGNVCMDMIMVDVTEIDCQEGDEVIVFGDNPTAEEIAQTINSISYELLTAISQRVKRVVLRK